MKKAISLALAVILIICAFSGCSSNENKNYIADGFSDETLIIGYTEDAEPFIKGAKDGNATGFYPELWKKIFGDIKGDLKNYRFEKVKKGYILEEDGGFFDKEKKEYSAGLLMGAVKKNDGTFNEDYSYTEPIITNRIIAVVKKGSNIKRYSDFNNSTAVVTGDEAKTALEKNTAVRASLSKVDENKDIKSALALLDSGKTDVVITDEFSFKPLKVDSKYSVLDGELDTIEYVIACAKNSDWKNSINEAIRELKSKDYGDGDNFTPIVEKYFGYNASSFDYINTDSK